MLVDQRVVERIGDRLQLRDVATGTTACLELDDVKRRLRQGRRLALARACGVRSRWSVLDAMAGLGLDGITLAALGCRVVMVERDPLLSRLLDDALDRARRTFPSLGPIEAVHADIRTLTLLQGDYDAIYLDPMFPARAGALPRKSAQLLAMHVGAPDSGLDELLLKLRAVARHRVVLKRRRYDPVVAPPDWQIIGRSVRFDVYRGGTPTH